MLVRYEPWNAVRELSDHINRAFGQLPTRVHDASDAATSAWTPAVDVREEEQRFVIAADVPGIDPADIEVTMEDGVLTIKGERKLETEQGGNHGQRRTERHHGVFYRRFTLPDSADAEQVSAQGKNGVLEVTIPKTATPQPKRIAVAA